MPSDPLILAFDTSAAHCAAAVVRGPEELTSECVPMARGQAEALTPLVQDVLRRVGVALADLDAIGVGTGPGNFTGTRISVALARGLSLGARIPAIGVSLLDAYNSADANLVCIGARRGFVYVQEPEQVGTTLPELIELSRAAERFGSSSGLICAGPAAQEFASLIGGLAIAPSQTPAVSVARAALRRWREGPPFDRPAPLYLRAPDAAPARDAAPLILP